MSLYLLKSIKSIQNLTYNEMIMCYNLDIIVKKVQELPKYKIYDISLFIASIIVGLLFVPLEVELTKCKRSLIT